MLSFFLSLLFFFSSSSHIESLRSVGCRSLSSSSFSQCALEAPSPTVEKLSQSSHTSATPFGAPQFCTTFHAFSLLSSRLVFSKEGKWSSSPWRCTYHVEDPHIPCHLYQPLPISAPDYPADFASQAPFWRQFFLCVYVEFGHVSNFIGFVEFIAVSTGSQVLWSFERSELGWFLQQLFVLSFFLSSSFGALLLLRRFSERVRRHGYALGRTAATALRFQGVYFLGPVWFCLPYPWTCDSSAGDLLFGLSLIN